MYIFIIFRIDSVYFQSKKFREMNENYLKNNRVFLSGRVAREPQYSHELFGEGFYEFYIEVKRLSGQTARLFISFIACEGQFRSHFPQPMQPFSHAVITSLPRHRLEQAT